MTHYLLIISKSNICIDTYPITKTSTDYDYGKFDASCLNDINHEIVTQAFYNGRPQGTIIVREPGTHTLSFKTQPVGTRKYLGNGTWE